MRSLLRWLQPLLALVAALFIIAFVAQQAPELRAYSWSLNAGWLLLSALLMLASWALEIRIWSALLAMLGGHMAYFDAARIWFLTAVVRYIPGNIWQPLSMTLYAQKRGVAPEATVTSILLYQLVILVAAGPMAALYFWAFGNWGILLAEGGPGAATAPLLALLLLPLLLLILLPHLLVRALNWILRRAGRPLLEQGFQRGRLLLMVLLAMVDWLLWGATFATLTFGLTSFAPAEMLRLAPHLILSYPIAYSVGFLSILLPSGFGVREGALYVLLAPLMAGSVATVAALAMRLWTVLGEVIMAILAAFAERRQPAQEPALAEIAPPLETEPQP